MWALEDDLITDRVLALIVTTATRNQGAVLGRVALASRHLAAACKHALELLEYYEAAHCFTTTCFFETFYD